MKSTRRVVVASKNPDKIREVEAVLERMDHPWEIVRGLDWQDVVRVHYIVPNRQDFPACWPALVAKFGSHPPAATMFVADLLDPSMKIEIEITAKIRSRTD